MNTVSMYVRLIVLSCFVGTVLYGVSAHAESNEILFDINNTSHAVLGFGAQIWAGDTSVERVFRELNTKYVRMANAGNEELQTTFEITDRLGIKVVLQVWGIPKQFMNDENSLLPEHIEGFAAWWGERLTELEKFGMRPAYLELSNEPDGRWNTYMAPEIYNSTVKQVRAELDSRGFDDVGIVGPGLAFLDLNDSGKTWVEALDDDAVHALAAWSTHSWDEKLTGSYDHTPDFLRDTWTEFGDAVKRKDPERMHPIIVTEYATYTIRYHGVLQPDPDFNVDFTAADTVPYAIHVYENTLSLLNLGANAAIYWSGTDSARKGWGYLRSPERGSTPKPVFWAMKTLTPHIPDGAQVIIPPQQQNNDIYAAAFVKNNRLVLALSNCTAQQRSKTIRFPGIKDLQTIEALAFEGDEPISKTVTADPVNNSFDVTLPAESTLTVICDFMIE